MLKANYFTYAGIYSGIYGLRIVSFDGNSSLDETTIFSPQITTEKSKNTNKFLITNISYNSPVEMEITIASENAISNIVKKEILSWLNTGKDFQKLILDKDDYEIYYYLCKFKDISELSINGATIGFKINAVFASPYQFGKDTISTLKSEEKTKNDDGFYEMTILNKSDIEDYIYPVVNFQLNSGTEITIINITDNINREFKFTKISNTDISVDNDLKIITGNGVLLSNFNLKWLRLLKGKNILKVKFGADGNGSGIVKITCPQIINIGY